MGIETLRVDVAHHDGETTVTVHGDVDANSALTLRAALENFGLERRVLVDMAGVGFMDSSGLHVLLSQSMRMNETGGSIHICNPSRAVRRVVEITALSEVLFEPEDSDVLAQQSPRPRGRRDRSPDGTRDGANVRAL